MADIQKSPTAVEKIKLESNYLRGAVAAELGNDNPAFASDTAQLLKHHGMYQQDDRDARIASAGEGKKSGRAYSLMVRTKVPGGILTTTQFLNALTLGDKLGNATIRLTDRQTIQFHGVLKRNVREHIQRIVAMQMTTMGACGDVSRNVLACPAPLRQDPRREEMQALARRISDHLLPKSRAYAEIWLTDNASGERELVAGGADDDVEPIYGRKYLPRKFKVALTLPEDNCVDVHANDLGLLAVCDGPRIVGYNVLVGGGMGLTPSNKNTFAAVAQPLAFIQPDEVIDIVTTIVTLFRDFGDRTDRKRARLKYLLRDWGLPRFKAALDERCGRPLLGPQPTQVAEVHDHLGWSDQGDGRWFYGLNIENGRVLDRPGFTLKAALREICESLQPGVRITALQSLLLIDLEDAARPQLEAILRRHGVRLSEETSMVRRWSIACVALPTCPLAVAESERVLPGVLDELESELARLGLADERIVVHMTGCPNGCARPYNAEIGLVGKTAGKYTLYLGGRVQGDRLGFIYKEIVPLGEVLTTLAPLLAAYKTDRALGESFGDFCCRLGVSGLAAAAEKAGPTAQS